MFTHEGTSVGQTSSLSPHSSTACLSSPLECPICTCPKMNSPTSPQIVHLWCSHLSPDHHQLSVSQGRNSTATLILPSILPVSGNHMLSPKNLGHPPSTCSPALLALKLKFSPVSAGASLLASLLLLCSPSPTRPPHRSQSDFSNTKVLSCHFPA